MDNEQRSPTIVNVKCGNSSIRSLIPGEGHGFEITIDHNKARIERMPSRGETEVFRIVPKED